MEKAHDHARQAEVTSNLESGDDSPETRKRPHNKGSLEEFFDTLNQVTILQRQEKDLITKAVWRNFLIVETVS